MTEQNLNLIVEGKNKELRLADWQYGDRVEVLRQSRKKQFVSPFRGALEDCYYDDCQGTGRYHWRTAISDRYIVKNALRLIENPPKELQQIGVWTDYNDILRESMTPRGKPSWANGIYVELPPKPIMVAKGWLVWGYSYKFMEVKLRQLIINEKRVETRRELDLLRRSDRIVDEHEFDGWCR
jgi:hypothetical protein